MALTATVEPSNGSLPPRVRLNVSGRSGSGTVQVVRLDPGGSTSDAVRGDITYANGSGSSADYEPPYGLPVSWITADAAAEASNVVVLDSPVTWLVHPFRPGVSLAIGADRSQGLATFTRDAFRQRRWPSSSALLEPLNRDDAIVQRAGRRRARESSMTIRTHDVEQEEALEQLLEDDAPLLLNVPPALGWRLGAQWVQVTDVEDVRVGVEGSHPFREWTLPFRRVARPAGALAGRWLSGDLLDTYSTSAELLALFETSGHLERNQRRTA